MQVVPQETEEGNIEYKRYFTDLTKSKLNHLTAQMNWRINEGNGDCHYYIGICDNGFIYNNITQEQIDYTLDMLKIMVEGCASFIEYIKINRQNDLLWLDIFIKRKHECMTEYRILVNNYSLENIIPNYITKSDIFYNTIIHNNEKYLFFENVICDNNDYINMLDFNLAINYNNDYIKTLYIDNISCYSTFINMIEDNITGNKINENNLSYSVLFNIIKYHHIFSLGHIISGFLKYGTIKKGMKLYLEDNTHITIISIHNNMIDCDSIKGPVCISLRFEYNIPCKNNYMKDYFHLNKTLTVG
jgi:hypothetical protein